MTPPTETPYIPRLNALLSRPVLTGPEIWEMRELCQQVLTRIAATERERDEAVRDRSQQMAMLCKWHGIEADPNGSVSDLMDELTKRFVAAKERALEAERDAAKAREDAERYREIRHSLSIVTDGSGGYEFSIRSIKPLGNVMKGSIAGHLDDAIDALKSASKEPS